MEFNFIGGDFTSLTLNQNAQRTYNWFVEKDESGAGASKEILLCTPGLVKLSTLPTSPVRGIFAGGSLAVNASRIFVVSGSILYEINAAGGIVSTRGNVGTDASNSPVQMHANGNQLIIISAGLVWVDNGAGPVAAMYLSTSYAGFVSGIGAGFTINWGSGDQFDPSMQGSTITIQGTTYTVATVLNSNSLTLTTALAGSGFLSPLAYSVTVGGGQVQGVTGAFLDGYSIAQTPNSNQIQISAINDATNWNPLDFAVKEGAPDHIVSLLADHEQLWLMGDNTGEVWDDTGAATFPLGRDPSGFIQQGCGAPWSVVSLGQGVAWIGSKYTGRASAWYAQGYQPQRISTHAVETAWAGYTIQDASSYVCEFNGHIFWVISFPTSNATWAYDSTEGVWDEWGSLIGGVQARHLASCHAFAFNAHYVGAFNSGNIYLMSLAYASEDGAAITRIRTAPHINQERWWIFYEQFWLDIQAGAAFTISLEISDDGGHTFGNLHTITLAAVTTARALWRRLSRSRDRVFRVTITSSTALPQVINAYLGAKKGLF